MEDYLFPNDVEIFNSNDSNSFESVKSAIDVNRIKKNASEIIMSLGLNDIPSLFLDDIVINDINILIDKDINDFETQGIEFTDEKYDDYIDYKIKKYIFDNISYIIFFGEENIFRLYMVVFDPFGDIYVNMYNSNSDKNQVKKEYMKYLSNEYTLNKDLFKTKIGEFLNRSGETGLAYITYGSFGAPMHSVVEREKERCPTNSIKIVNGHGSIVPNEIFRIPEGCKVITLSQTNVCVPHTDGPEDIQLVYVPLMKLYMDGGSIFEGDDTVKELKKDYYSLIKYYKDLGKTNLDDENYLNFQYALHLPGDVITDMYIQTQGSGCENDGCNVICFEKGQEGSPNPNNYLNYVKFIPEGKGTFTLPEYVGQMTKLSNILEEMGDGTYIIYACRHVEEETYELSRTLSNNVRGPGYNAPFKGVREDKFFTVSTIKQPGDIDNKKIYRYHIEFLDEYSESKKQIDHYNELNIKLNDELTKTRKNFEIKVEQAKKFYNLALRCKQALEKEKSMKKGGGKRAKNKDNKRTKKGGGNKRTKKRGGNKRTRRKR